MEIPILQSRYITAIYDTIMHTAQQYYNDITSVRLALTNDTLTGELSGVFRELYEKKMTAIYRERTVLVRWRISIHTAPRCRRGRVQQWGVEWRHWSPTRDNRRVCSLGDVGTILPWWHHQMETFSAILALCAGNSPVTGEFPITKASDVELWCFLWFAPE